MNDLPYEGERIVCIEFCNHQLKPYQVFTVHPTQMPSGVVDDFEAYDIEYSRYEKSLVIAECGGGIPFLSGPEAHYWLDKDYPLDRVDVLNPRTGLVFKKRKPKPVYRVQGDQVLGGFPNPKKVTVSQLADHVVWGSSLHYCNFCKDWYLEPSGYTDVICKHISWCDTCSMWSSPEERCKHDKRKAAR